jgi:HK97 family phage prohead protease
LVESRTVTHRPIEVRDAETGDGLNFTGYASVTEVPYEMYDLFGPYSEVVSRGAFEATLKTENLDVPLVLNHDSLRRLARTTNGSLMLAEDDIGLCVDAPNLDPTDLDVAYIAPKLRNGLIDEMSFRFSITAGQWSPDYTEYRIEATDIHRGDVAIVGYGASPTTVAQLRSLTQRLAEDRGLGSADLSAVDMDLLHVYERAIRKELHRRGVKPSMSFQDLLAL